MARAVWAWRRSIPPGREEEWIERLQGAGCATWTLTERPGRKRILLAVYHEKRESALALRKQFGGLVRPVKQSEWLPTKPAPPTRIGRLLEIVHEKTPRAAKSEVPHLLIPHGLAFGSGEHATTFMLLRALANWTEWSRTSVLDLGAGSGVLALATRKFGAKKIAATDFDPDAIRTARQNEALNFITPLIRWRCADVRKLSAEVRYDLVLANLFSGILCEAAAQIAGCVSPGGQLWLSGILHSQEEEILATYRAEGLHLKRVNRRGKWIMLQWAAPIRKRSHSQRTPRK